MKKGDSNYIYLAIDPSTPEGKYPSKADCIKYEYIKMSQLCEISDRKGLGGSRACNAFGGDKGQYKVITERMARAVMHKTQPRKYVLTTAAILYLKEFGIEDW